MLRTPLLRISGRSCHKLNLELEFLSKLICGGALLSVVLVGSASDGVSSLGELSSGSVWESCSRLVSISWRVDLSRYSWYKSPRRQHNRSERLQLNKRVDTYCGKGYLFCICSPQQRWERSPPCWAEKPITAFLFQPEVETMWNKWKAISKSTVLSTICSHKTLSNTVR